MEMSDVKECEARGVRRKKEWGGKRQNKRMGSGMPEKEIGRGGHCNRRPDPAVLKRR